MTKEDYWRIFKNTGSVEAYITYAQSSVCLENKNVINNQNIWDDTQDKRYAGEGQTAQNFNK